MPTTRILALLGAAGVLALAIPLFADEGGGLQTTRFADGTPRERAVWVDGERDGECSRWYRDGTLREEGEFVDGRRVGRWVFRHEDGSLDESRSGLYEAGRLVERSADVVSPR